MIPAASRKRLSAFTLIELLVVVAIIAILAFMALPMRNVPDKSKTSYCMSNLRQVNLGFLIWADTNTNQFPWEVSTNSGGTMELISQGNAADHFLPIATICNNPRVFACPTDKSRHTAANIISLGSSNLSYFISTDVSLKSSASPASTILAGDRHLSLNNQAVKTGLFETTNFTALGWTAELHGNRKNSLLGVVTFADGHCEVVKNTKLPDIFQRQPIATNRLVIP